MDEENLYPEIRNYDKDENIVQSPNTSLYHRIVETMLESGIDVSADVFKNGLMGTLAEDEDIDPDYRELPSPAALLPFSAWLIPEEEREDPTIERLPSAFTGSNDGLFDSRTPSEL